MSRETFLSEKKRIEMKNLLVSINEHVKRQPLFVRTYLAIFIPYPTIGLLESNEVDA